MNITVYVKSNCIQCVQTKKHLDKLNIAYKTVSVEEDEQAYDYIVNRLGYKAAPVIIVTDDDEETAEHWSGYNPEKIKGLINE